MKLRAYNYDYDAEAFFCLHEKDINCCIGGYDQVVLVARTPVTLLQPNDELDLTMNDTDRRRRSGDHSFLAKTNSLKVCS